jgi:hypothetical protein
LCQKCTETRLHASVNSKNFPRVIPPDPCLKREGRKGRREGWIGKNGTKRMGRKDEVEEERIEREDS